MACAAPLPPAASGCPARIPQTRQCVRAPGRAGGRSPAAGRSPGGRSPGKAGDRLPGKGPPPSFPFRSRSRRSVPRLPASSRPPPPLVLRAVGRSAPSLHHGRNSDAETRCRGCTVGGASAGVWRVSVQWAGRCTECKDLKGREGGVARVVRWMHGREGWHSEAEAERTVIRHAFRHTKRRERRKRPPRSPRKEREGWHSEAERTVCRHASRPAERRKRSTESAQGPPERRRGHCRWALAPPPPPRPPAHLCTTGMDPSVHARTHACTHARAHTHTYADARTPSPAFLACTPRPERGCPFLACTEGVRAAAAGGLRLQR